MASAKISERIEASATAVWDLLGDFGGVMRYSEGLEGCSTEGEGVGAVRTIRMPGGLELDERLEAFDEARRCLSYAITRGPLPLENYLATIEVNEDGDACRVDWGATYDLKGVTEEQAREMVEGIYTGSLQAVRKKLGV